jgi:hypothetical protein
MLPKKVRKKLSKYISDDEEREVVLSYLDSKWPVADEAINATDGTSDNLPELAPFATDPPKELTKAEKKAAKKAFKKSKKDGTLDSFPLHPTSYSKGDTILVKMGSGRPKRATVDQVSAKSGNIKCTLIAKQEEIIATPDMVQGLAKQ